MKMVKHMVEQLAYERQMLRVSRATTTRFGLAKGPHQVVMT